MTFPKKADVAERRLRERGYIVKREKRLLKIYTANGFGRFPRKLIDEVLAVADSCGTKISASQPFLIHKNEDR